MADGLQTWASNWVLEFWCQVLNVQSLSPSSQKKQHHIVHPKLRNINPHGPDVRSSNLTPCCHISFSYILKFFINANYSRSQPTLLHWAMCQHVECHLLILFSLLLLMPLVECWCMCLSHCMSRPSGGVGHTGVR